jgi:hypothetical protein
VLKSQPILTMRRDEVVTAVFAFQHYVRMLKAEIKNPSCEKAAAESATALAGAKPLLERMDLWLTRNSR